jgi:hypothetical protein
MLVLHCHRARIGNCVLIITSRRITVSGLLDLWRLQQFELAAFPSQGVQMPERGRDSVPRPTAHRCPDSRLQSAPRAADAWSLVTRECGWGSFCCFYARPNQALQRSAQPDFPYCCCTVQLPLKIRSEEASRTFPTLCNAFHRLSATPKSSISIFANKPLQRPKPQPRAPIQYSVPKPSSFWRCRRRGVWIRLPARQLGTDPCEADLALS